MSSKNRQLLMKHFGEAKARRHVFILASLVNIDTPYIIPRNGLQ